MNTKRLNTIAKALQRNPELQPTGHWLQSPNFSAPRGSNGVFLTRDELIDLVKIAAVIDAECVKYGLEDMRGNPAENLLRHMAGSTGMVIGAKDTMIGTLQRKLWAADALAIEAGARKYHTFNDLQVRVDEYRKAK